MGGPLDQYLSTRFRTRSICHGNKKRNTLETKQILNLEDGETSAVQQRVKAKWTVEMNTALLESRKEAEQLHNTDNCPRKDNGRKDGIMELADRIWDEKRFAHLRKTPQNHGSWFIISHYLHNINIERKV